MKKLLIGELLVMLFVVIGVDHFGWVIAWLPFIIYNILYLRRIVELIPWE